MRTANTRTASAHHDAIPQFEWLLADLSAGFINLPATRVDSAINDALRRIARLIGADLSQLIRIWVDGDARVTHSGAVDSFSAVASESIAGAFPWVLQGVRDGYPVIIRSVDTLPVKAAVDRASFQRAGVQANLSMPLRVGGRVEGLIAFGCLGRERDWPEELVARVAVLADVFANALAHKRAQEALDAAMRFEHLVSEILAALLTARRDERDRVIETGLRDVAQAFGAERATLWQRAADRDQFMKTHRWLAPGVPKPAELSSDDALPWSHRRLVAGEVVRFARHADLPREAETDLRALSALGICAALIVPLNVSGSVVGALSLSSASAEHEWPDALIPRVMLLGEVFASVVACEASERREHEAQSEAAHAARVGMMGMFAAALVHELTQPLAASLANAETAADLLATPSPDLEELRVTVDDIVTDDRRVGELIQQLRRFLRRGEAEWAEFDIDDVIHDNFRIVAGAAAEKGIVITLDIPDSLPTLTGDRVQLQQVLLNLLLNALDAVAARDGEPRRIGVTAHATGEAVSVEVSDTGHGMDEATVAHVFQPFFTTKPGGMGLGLSISRSIVIAHGGRLSVRSATGEGTTFRIELPSHHREAAQRTLRKADAPGVTGTVFVVDDDPSMRRAVERQLRSVGYRVESFDSAQSFLDRSPEFGIACVVSDLRMPGMSGLDLQASLAKAQCDLPIVFISGHGDVSTTVHALKSGAVNFLAKPFTKSALLSAVADALARSGHVAAERGRRGALEARHNILTPREREVLSLVAAGMLNKVIADRLGIAEATIKIHRGRVMEKMGAASVADLVRIAEILKP
jgi:FixJ family two-component response regulator/signal transduction histidine kinase